MMKIRMLLMLGVAAAFVSITTVAQAQQDSSLLPAKGLPGKYPLVVRVDLEKFQIEKLTATLNSIAKIFPEEETKAHEGIALIRDDILPAIGDIRGILQQAGVEQIVFLSEMPGQEEEDFGDDDEDDDEGDDEDDDNKGILLFKVGPDATREGVQAVLPKSLDRYVKAVLAVAKMEEKAGNKDDADETFGKIEEAKEEIKKTQWVQWEKDWLMAVGPDQTELKTAEPNKKGLADLQAALKRSGVSPISIAYHITDEDRAKIAAGAQGNPMFGQMAGAAANMKWLASWMDFGAEPQFNLAMMFGTQQDAAQFKTQMNQMLNFLQMMMTMNQGQNQKAGQVAMALVADLLPAQEGQELLVTLTKSTFEKMYEMSKVMQEMNQGGPGGGAQPGPGEDF
jgi:hypothetical protein